MQTGFDKELLLDRTAVVTGAAGGIGLATAQALCRVGARVALCDRNESKLSHAADSLREQHSGQVFEMNLDVREPEAVQDFIAKSRDALGPIEILVNNAGGTFAADFVATSPGAEDALIEENFKSVTSLTREVLTTMPTGRGSIINITSIEAHRAAPGYSTYAAMKAAVDNLTKTLAIELAPRGIRVNAIAPDAIPTPGTHSQAATTPLGRPGSADEVASMVVFLASDLAAFTTGTTIHIDGGIHAAGGWRRKADGTFYL
jgi:NAD(P)-dependent dehydrogenase (short-subunit alcohol dehydrogenase family)